MPPAGLVEAWAQSTLPRERGDFLQSEMEAELVFISRLWLGSVAGGHWSQEAGFCPAGPALSGEGLRGPTTVAAAQPQPRLLSAPPPGTRELSLTEQIAPLEPSSRTAGWRVLSLICFRSKGFPASPVPFPLTFLL